MWHVRPSHPARADEIAKALQVPRLVAEILVARGQAHDVETARTFLEPRLAQLVVPEAMADLDRLTARLVEALDRGDCIGVFGDFDVDGVTSAAVIGEALRQVGATVFTRVARRDEGYGFSVGQAEELLQRGATLILLTDCGTSDHEAVAWAAARGVDVVAVDHHRVVTLGWPGLALVNPHRGDCGFPDKGLCSAGLAFFVIAALRARLVACGRTVAWDPRGFLDLVALGTLADVATLVGQNRILVHRGLAVLRRTTRPGLQELCALSKVRPATLTVEDVIWRLTPRLNAPGRLGDAAAAHALLTATTTAEAVAAARTCDRLNTERKRLQDVALRAAMTQAEEQKEAPLIVVGGADWHPGVVGIVASRLVEVFRRPAAVVSWDGEVGRGSARSVPGVDLVDLLSRAAAHLVRHGGHAAAAGFTVEREQFAAFSAALTEAAAALGPRREPPLSVDAVVSLAAIDQTLFAALDNLSPFGQGNPKPLFAAGAVEVRDVRVVGNGHLALVLREGQRSQRAIGFGLARWGQPAVGDRVDVAFSLAIDAYQGEQVQLNLRDVVSAGEGLPVTRATGEAEHVD